MEILKIENLSKKFKNTVALSNINFSINNGEVTSIIGPSGSGKSTLLRLICNLEKTDSGSIIINKEYLLKDGKYNKDIRNIIRNIGMIFQEYSLFDNLTIKENIELAPKLVLNKTKDQTGQLSMDLLIKFNLLDKLNSYPSELSGGQKQRVAIARSIAMNPKILLLDEPTSALDIEAINNLVDIIEDFKKNNMTIIIVSHDIEFAKKVSNKLIFMDNSEILFETNNINEITNQRFINFINKQ